MKKQRGSLWDQPVLTVVQNHLVRYPTPSNQNGNYNWGVLAGLCQVLQILTGIFQAMHYTAHVDQAFHSVQHLMRDVPNGWQLRYLHANGASLFFIVVYMHLFRGLYYTSYAQPREFVWLVGVVILLVMILTAFIGYVQPWGNILPKMSYNVDFFGNTPQNYCQASAFYVPRILARKRIGPHNYDILCFFYGALLGDAHAEKHGQGTRLTFHHSSKQVKFLYWMRSFQAQKGYCRNSKLKMTTQIGKKGQLYYSMKFHTFTFQSLNWIHDEFYHQPGNEKKVPKNILCFLSPLALAIWIQMDGHFTGHGLRLHTEGFSLEDNFALKQAIFDKFGWKVTMVKKNKYVHLYIPAKHIKEQQQLVGPYLDKSILSKINKNNLQF